MKKLDDFIVLFVCFLSLALDEGGEVKRQRRDEELWAFHSSTQLLSCLTMMMVGVERSNEQQQQSGEDRSDDIEWMSEQSFVINMIKRGGNSSSSLVRASFLKRFEQLFLPTFSSILSLTLLAILFLLLHVILLFRTFNQITPKRKLSSSFLVSFERFVVRSLPVVECQSLLGEISLLLLLCCVRAATLLGGLREREEVGRGWGRRLSDFHCYGSAADWVGIDY